MCLNWLCGKMKAFEKAWIELTIARLKQMPENLRFVYVKNVMISMS